MEARREILTSKAEFTIQAPRVGGANKYKCKLSSLLERSSVLKAIKICREKELNSPWGCVKETLGSISFRQTELEEIIHYRQVSFTLNIVMFSSFFSKISSKYHLL